jgi:hypothetical protein
MFVAVRHISFAFAFILFALVSSARAQQVDVTRSSTDGSTPSALAPGAHPLSSFGGSDFDRINLFNGSLSMSFKIASLGGRNGAGVALTLSQGNKTWRSERREQYTRPSDTPTGHLDYAVNDLYNPTEPLLLSGWKFNAGGCSSAIPAISPCRPPATARSSTATTATC